MTNELVVLLDGNEVGRVRNDARGRLTNFRKVERSVETPRV
jgi:hypothetical protein